MPRRKRKTFQALFLAFAVTFVLTLLPLPRAAASVCPSMFSIMPINDIPHLQPVTLDDIPFTMREYTERESITCPSVDADTKVLPLATIVVGFQNMPYEDEFDWSNHLFQSEASLQQYYLDMSYRQMTFVPVRENSACGNEGNTCVKDHVNDGIIHVKLDVKHESWMSPDIEFESKSIVALAAEEAGKVIDFSGYDQNGNGVIDKNELALMIVFAGYDASRKEEIVQERPHIWPQYLFSIDDNNYTLSNDVTIHSLAVIPEKIPDDAIETMSNAAHELGHHLGLPDLYSGSMVISPETGLLESPDTGWIAYQPDYLSLMSSGNVPGYCHLLDIWSKCRLGWVEPVLLSGEASSELLSAGTMEEDGTPRALRINIPGREKEYYLLENRQFEGWDATLGSRLAAEKGGVILWHISEEVLEKEGIAVSIRYNPAVTPLFREVDSEGNPTLIGERVLHRYPFFDRTIQETVYENVNGYMNLPVYGMNIYSPPQVRSYSDVGIRFTSENGTKMSVQLKDDNHVWNAGRVTVQPTKSAEGERRYTCSFCGATKTESIPKLKANPLTVKTASKTYNYAELTKAKTFKIGATKAQGKVTYSPNAAAKKAKITVKSGTVTIPKKCAVGTYKITVKAAGNDTFAAGSKTVTIKVTKAANPLKVSVSSKTYKSAKLKKAAAFSIGASKAQGKVTYTPDKKSKAAKIKVTAKGKVTVPKKCRKGTYTIMVKAKGNSNYKAGSKKVIIKVK